MTGAMRGHLAMFVFSGLVAGSFSLGSLSGPYIAPVAVTAPRFLLAAALLGVLAALGPGVRRQDLQAPWRYFVLGGIFSVYFVLMFEGLLTASPVSTAAVFTLTPAMAAGFGFVLLGQVMTGRIAVALAIGGVGALWVIFRADWAAFRAFEVGRGEVIFFFGCMAHAIYTPLVRVLNRGEHPVVFSFGTLIGGAAVLFIWGMRDMLTTDWAALPAIVWITLLYVSIFASAVTFVLVQFAALNLPSAKVMACTYLVPSWVILWEVGLGNPLPPGLIWVGVGLTVLALLLLLKSDVRE